jgi:FkbM family methyltransferase
MREGLNIKKNNNLIYDVGMHTGEDTEFYLKKGFKVIAFEADPDLVKHCTEKFAKEIESETLTIIEGAITEKPSADKKKISFYRNLNISSWGTIDKNLAHRYTLDSSSLKHLGTKNEIICVPIIDFSECLQKYGIPHYLKVDIEGSDILCIKILFLFKQRPDFISIEADIIGYLKFIKDLKVLLKLGYREFKIIQQDGISAQREPNPSKEGYYSGIRIQEGSSGLFGDDLPGLWKTYTQTFILYGLIFLQHKIFGVIRKFVFGRKVYKKLRVLLHHPLPGWHDVHARRFTK